MGHDGQPGKHEGAAGVSPDNSIDQDDSTIGRNFFAQLSEAEQKRFNQLVANREIAYFNGNPEYGLLLRSRARLTQDGRYILDIVGREEPLIAHPSAVTIVKRDPAEARAMGLPVLEDDPVAV